MKLYIVLLKPDCDLDTAENVQSASATHQQYDGNHMRPCDADKDVRSASATSNDIADMHDDGNHMRPCEVRGQAVPFCVWRMANSDCKGTVILNSSNLNNVQTLRPQTTLPFHA